MELMKNKTMNPQVFIKIGQFILKNWKYVVYLIQIIGYFVKLKKKKPMNPNVEKLRDKLIKIIDDKTSTGMFDSVDQYAYKQLFNGLFHLLEQNANPIIIDVINKLATSIVTGSDDESVEYLTAFINGKIDIPKLDEEEEAHIIKSILVTIAVALRGILTK